MCCCCEVLGLKEQPGQKEIRNVTVKGSPKRKANNLERVHQKFFEEGGALKR
jgi:hypothetical protein